MRSLSPTTTHTHTHLVVDIAVGEHGVEVLHTL